MKTKREIIVFDDLHPEDCAMAQALYSRSPKSITEHFEKIKKVGSGNFMGQYYVGYGHKSIGDCGTTTIASEHVSMLAAKAIQDWPLYNGQEASTRYLDMSEQDMLNPVGTKEGEQIQASWRNLYEHALEELIPHLSQLFPKEKDASESDWTKAIKAKAFDIARSLLPAGTTTYLSWHTNLRQAHDHLQLLVHHPVDEIRAASNEILEALQAKYPHSFNQKKYEATEKYLEASMSQLAYFMPEAINEWGSPEADDRFRAESHLHSLHELKSPRFAGILHYRPKGAELPMELRKFGQFRFEFLLDFGSYRDLQRQRSMICPVPLLTERFGFHPWYLEQMPENLRTHVTETLELQAKNINGLDCSEETRQYYLPMGYRVPCEVTADLRSTVYITELRSQQTVHPTLRLIAQQMGEFLNSKAPSLVSLTLHHDTGSDVWSTKRGQQDIVAK